jgi:hypothetical protein
MSVAGYPAPNEAGPMLAELLATGDGPPALRAAVADRWGLRPLNGGRTNHVYAWAAPQTGPCVVKVFPTDHRRRADAWRRTEQRRRIEREWAALTLLADHQIGGVPRPLWVLPGPVAAIGMTLVAGTPLLETGDVSGGLAGLAQLGARLQQIPLHGVLADLERIDSASHYIRRITEVWPAQLAEHPDDPLTGDMRRLIRCWQDSGDRDTLALADQVVFSRGDANLLNWLRHDRETGCVDFEFAGHSTPSFDAADHVEHISAATISDDTWQPLLPTLGVTDANQARFGAAQRTCALRWLAVLWRQRHQRQAEFDRQCTRVRHLQTHAS